MTIPTDAAAAFEPAARRHHADALHLCHHDRHASADHLAGLAAECALKALLVGFFGVQVPERGRPYDRQKTQYGHLPHLWGQVQAVAQGRVGAQFLVLMSGNNPFDAWDVSDRYSDGSTITAQRAWAHVAASSTVLRIQQQARLLGAIP